MQRPDSGGMDKRTLIAFALMILVWVLFTQLMPKPQQPAAPTAAPTPVAAAPETLNEAPPPTSAGAVEPVGRTAAGGGRIESVLPAEERTVVVEGPLYTAVFTTRGAALQSFRLKQYTDAEEGPVELVQEPRGALGLAIDGPAGLLDCSQTVFQLNESREGGGDGASLRVLRFVAESDPANGAPVRIERTYRLHPERYDWTMEVVVSGVANQRLDHRLLIGWEHGIPNVETQAKLERGAKAAVALLAQELVKHGFGGGEPGCGCGGGEAARGGERPYEGTLRWAGVRSKYFAGVIVPEEEVAATVLAQSDPARDAVGLRLRLPMADQGRTTYRFTLYTGPIDLEQLRALDRRLDKELVRLVDFGVKLIAPLSKAIYWFMDTVHAVVPNYGLVIIILAIFVRLIFHPLNQRAVLSQRKMQALKPEMDEINQKYKENPEQRSKRQMELYKRNGINPLGGCLPILIQLPVFYGLYNVLMNTIKLRKEPFFLWMQDLAVPDRVGAVFGVPIHILPLLMAATMFVQQKMTPTDPRQAPLMLMMPLMMVFFFYGLPSGLVLYWTVTNVLAIAQQMLMKQPVLVPAPAAADPKPERRRFGRK